MMIISDYKKIEGKGALSAAFNLTLPKWACFMIRGLTLFEANGKRWITMPSRQYEAEGKKKYYEHVLFPDRDTNDKFKTAILATLDQYVAKTSLPMESVYLPGIAKGTASLPKDPTDDLPF